MSGADIAGIVISVVATLISLGTLIYTIYADCRNKKAIEKNEKYQEENDKEVKVLKDQLNNIIKDGFHELSESISRLNENKNQQNIFKITVVNSYPELPSKEKKKISEQKGLYNQKIKKVKKEQIERMRKKSVVQKTKK